MKSLRYLIAIACILGAANTNAGEKSAAKATTRSNDGGDNIKDKVSVALGQVLHVKFKAEGDRLLQPKTFQGPGDGMATVKIELKVTDATPFPVRGVATRPYLVISNGFDRALHCRALARRKGSKKFFEIGSDMEAIPPGENSLKCWESGSLVEEVVLYQFALSPKPSK